MSKPDILDWNDGQGYRRITNWKAGVDPYRKGGDNDGQVKWLDVELGTGPDSSNQTITYNYSPNPNYMWFMDTTRGDLKITDKSCDLTKVNPGGSGCSTSGSSCLPRCRVYDKHSGNDFASHFGVNSSYVQMVGDGSVATSNYFYFGNPEYSTLPDYSPKVMPKESVICSKETLGDGQANSTFYVPTDSTGVDGIDPFTGQTNAVPRAWSGSDCGTRTTDKYDYDSALDMDLFKFIDDSNAAKCCSLSDAETSAFADVCPNPFNPSRGDTLCPSFMADYCKDHWGDNTDTGRFCTAYLQNSPSSVETVRETIMNYLVNANRTNYGKLPQDYISPSVAVNSKFRKDPNSSISNRYCTVDPVSKTGSCPRDDSKDPFMINTLPFLCTFGDKQGVQGLQGVCDDILWDYCQQFSREDIAGDSLDPTLLNICGCHLLPTTANGQSFSSPNIAGKSLYLQGQPQGASPYYNEGSASIDPNKCDPLCINSQLPTINGRCTTQQCIIDDVTINAYKSNIGSINISQNCNNGSCYFSDITVSAFNSNVDGSLQLAQDCGCCYTFTNGDVSTAQLVDCTTFQPSASCSHGGSTPVKPPPTPPSGPTNTSKTWIYAILIIIAVIAIIGMVIVFSHGREHSPEPTQVYSNAAGPYGGYYNDINRYF